MEARAFGASMSVGIPCRGAEKAHFPSFARFGAEGRRHGRLVDTINLITCCFSYRAHYSLLLEFLL